MSMQKTIRIGSIATLLKRKLIMGLASLRFDGKKPLVGERRQHGDEGHADERADAVKLAQAG